MHETFVERIRIRRLRNIELNTKDLAYIELHGKCPTEHVKLSFKRILEERKLFTFN